MLTDYYYDRLKTRYLDPIDAIGKIRPPFQGEGFAIVAIQCSLVEFLESCWQGKNYRYNKPAGYLTFDFLKKLFRGTYSAQPPSKHSYKDSGKMFTSFLVNREPFRKQFNKVLAKNFYRSVRCGVLHEARTKGDWLIQAKSGSSLIINPYGPILYRDDFQEALIKFISDYRAEVPHVLERQLAFIRKFDQLCT